MLLLVCLILPVLFAAPGHTQAADDKAPLRIGVLSFRERSATDRQWGPLARYLGEQIPGQRFELRSLFLDEITRAVERDELDFVLTHPEHYVHLRALHGGLAPIATLATSANHRALSYLGGVIIRRSDRNDIATLADLRGARIAAAIENSIGGFRLQQWTLLKAGINIQKEAANIFFTGQPQDRVFEQVLQGKVDAGFVRTGVIEAMIGEGKLAPDALHIVNPRQEPDFPLLLSTPLAPEWPFLASQRVAEPIVKAVTLTLLQIDPDEPVALTGNFHSFSPPADYSRVETMMLELRAHPERLQRFDLQDIVQKYPYQVASSLSVLLFLALTGVVFLVRSRRQISSSLRERASLLDSLGEGVYGVNSNGRCSFINPKALEMLGWRREDVIGRDLHALFHYHRPDGSDYPASECPICRSLLDGQRRQGEEWYFRRNGEAFPVAFVATRSNNERSHHSVVVTFRDISEERRADEMMRIAAIAFETQEGMLVTDA
ncbi:MAG: PhnD/SsuA/transferrin family substrate-binding protein, partial [Betaproteobacteria bacterium]|nr:PhnD/SsuA/transferrin family substrate-binding protein [Betaproteobacteria bacterium]